MDEHDHQEENYSRQPGLPLSWEAGRAKDDGTWAYRRQSRAVPPADDNQVSDSEKGHAPATGDAAANRSRRRISLVNPESPGEPALPATTSADQAGAGTRSAGDKQDRSEPEAGSRGRDESGGGRQRRQLLSSSDWQHEGDELAESAGKYAVIQVPQLGASLGTALMQKRTERGLEVSEVCSRTRIPRDFIEHLEADRYERLPPPVYTRSYIAQLCREYGINPQLCLEAYDQAQGTRGASRRQSDSLVLVINSENEEGAVSYAPRPVGQYLDSQPGLMARLPRIAVMFATGLLVLVVLSAVLIQQYHNYRLRRGAREADEAVPVVIETRIGSLEELIPPQKIPFRELSIPRD